MSACKFPRMYAARIYCHSDQPLLKSEWRTRSRLHVWVQLNTRKKISQSHGGLRLQSVSPHKGNPHAGVLCFFFSLISFEISVPGIFFLLLGWRKKKWEQKEFHLQCLRRVSPKTPGCYGFLQRPRWQQFWRESKYWYPGQLLFLKWPKEVWWGNMLKSGTF